MKKQMITEQRNNLKTNIRTKCEKYKLEKQTKKKKPQPGQELSHLHQIYPEWL